MGKTSVADASAASAEAGHLIALAEPYGWWDITTIMRSGLYHIDGVVKAALAGVTTARAARSELLGAAEDFLAVLAAEGWQVMDTVRMDFRTDVRAFIQTVAGELVSPAEQQGTELRVDLTVGRPR